jgi:hypothetical protein
MLILKINKKIKKYYFNLFLNKKYFKKYHVRFQTYLKYNVDFDKET